MTKLADGAVRIGVVGLDHWYTAVPLVQTLAARTDVEVAGIIDTNLDRAREVAGRIGVDRVGTDPAELLEDSSVQAICSFVSSDRSPAICTAAAEAGKHLMSVKPMARTLERATDVVNAVRSAGVVFLGSESRARTSPQYRRLRRWIDEGRLGDILTASYSLWSSLPQSWPDADDPGWFADPTCVPGGGWIDHSIYQIDQLRWLLGAEVESVVGMTATVRHPDLAVEDYGHATLRFDNGTVATVEDTWTAVPGRGRSGMNLVGRDGAIAFDSLSGRVSVSGAGFAGDPPLFDGWAHLAPASGKSEDALDTWLAAVAGDADARAALPGSVEDSWLNLATCLAFYEAAATGRPVRPVRLAGIPAPREARGKRG